APEHPVTSAPGPVASAPPALTFRVLLVEDDPLHAALIRQAVEAIGDVDLQIADTVEKARQRLADDSRQGRPPSLILCDVNIGNLPGDEFVREVLQMPTMRLVPVVMISASHRSDDVLRALEAGARAYITKDQLAQDPAARLNDILRFWQLSTRAA
ncbi:MAG: response regulator, partial [Phycisphaerales bacterium JB038]